MIQTYWEHFEHGADIGIRGVGNSMADAFVYAAKAATAVITDIDTVADSEAVEIQCQGDDPELLLSDWINAVIYEMATRKMLFCHFEVEINGCALNATAWGEAVEIDRHKPAVEIKGATYTELKVEHQTDGSWLAQCIVDV